MSSPSAASPAAAASNPLVAGLERLPVPPTTMVIFGATGDLARRKLLPALYNLAHEGALPERFHMIGVSRRDKPHEDYRADCEQAIRRFSRRSPDKDVLEGLLEQVKYVSGVFDDDSVYVELARELDEFERAAGEPLARLFYLSTAPAFFPVIVEALGRQGLARRDSGQGNAALDGDGHGDHGGRDGAGPSSAGGESSGPESVRVIIEKPFGTSLAEAMDLNRRVLAVFEESQVFRIDHYLGKETVQNMMAFRFANGMFEPLWNRNYIDNVQITAAEDIGIEGRAGYYEGAGALRDLIQNHMLQLLCHVAMDPPVRFSAEEVRNEKVKVLRSIHAPAPEEVAQMSVRGQYAAGHAGGEDVPGYLEEEGVRADSNTETFAALRLEVDNWRWAGVPFYLRAGKRLARKVTEIAITLKPVPHLPFSREGSLGVRPNQLVLTVQPNEGVSLQLGAKIPGTRMVIRPVNMEFLYGTAFLSQSPEAYERLILDAMRGDATLFTRNDEVEAQWRICDPIVKAFEHTPGPLPQYEAGSQGPAEAREMMFEGQGWRAI
jgi:glucose-6-phosphate 1-dehydrogenase